MPSYVFLAEEPGLFVELYVPKKAELQIALYEILTAGLDVENLRRHFRDPERLAAVRRMLAANYPEAAAVDEDAVAGLPARLFIGYSIYEVDGVFYDPARKRAAEERTQIVRLVFVHDGCPPEHRDLVKQFLRSPDSRLETFLQSQRPTPEAEEAVRRAARWVDDVARVVFGYVVVELCRRIEEMARRNPAGDLSQDEIWVASFWNLVLNRVVNQDAPGG